MLASVTGIKYQDMTGDGFTPDDLPLGGFTIDLYRDGGDGVFDLVDDTLDGSQITDATTGEYTFSGLTDGRYFLQEQPLAGWTQTAGPAYYTFDVIGDNVYTDVGLVVDSFAEPDPADIWAISSFSPNPAKFTHTGSMLGGERELTIEVLDVPDPISASGSIGAGVLDFATGVGDPGSKAVLIYDGTLATPLSQDLTDGGANTAFRLDTTMIQVGGTATKLEVVIDLAGPAGTATYTGMLSESIGAESHYIPFADFTTTGTFSFQDVTSATVTFNPTGVPDVDFILDAIVVMQGPQSFDFGNYQELPDITGVKYHDVTGDGITGDDLPLGGFTIQLYRDNGNGVFDPVEDELVDTQVTDATTGEYTFSDLEDGRYFIREVPQAEWTQTDPLYFHTLDVEDQEIVASDGFDFGNTRDLPTLSGVKWHDILGDGITADDVPLGGFTIQLYRDGGDGVFDLVDDTLYDTQVTDATTGAYTFTHLLDGVYFVQEIVETDWTQTSPLAPEYYTIEVAGYALAVQTGYDFANTRDLPTVSGVKWHDITGDGITADDVPLGGFTIELYRDSNGDGILDGGDTLVATQTTDATTGEYAFANLINGRYFIREVAQTEWTQTEPLDYHTFDVVDYAVDVASGYDFANYRELPSIGGVKWHDVTGDGITADDLPLGGFTIELYRDNGNGIFEPTVDTLVDTQVTDATTGQYTFDDLIDGQYFIREVAQPDWTRTSPLYYHTLTVVDQVAPDVSYDFANTRELPTVSGVKYRDLDGDGITGDDLPLGGFTIDLYLDADGDGLFDAALDTYVTSQVTDAATGAYTFTHLLNGTYFVREVVGGVWTQTAPVSPSYYTIEVTDYALAVQTGYDFANYREPVSVSGTKYHDLDGDGITADDLPLGGFTIDLYLDADGDGLFDAAIDTYVTSQVTDATTGEYAFTLSDDGTYFIREVVSAGWSQTGPADPLYYTIEVVDGSTDVTTGFDFANYPDAPAISGVKYHDLTGDGITADDLPLGGFTIDLYRDANGDGMFDAATDTYVTSQVTDATTGEYTFSDLEDGTYFVREVVSDGWSQTSPADPAYYTVEIVNRLIVDAGDYEFANYPDAPVIGGVKYRDMTGDGITADDVPLTGFTIELYTDTNDDGVLDDDDELIDSQTTASDTGVYSFTDLADGRYFVREVAVDGWTRTAPADPGYYTVEIVNRLIVEPGEYDFANFAEPSSLSGFVYVDINNDGVKQASESVIANAVVWLSGVDNLGNTIDPISTTTDLTGAYTFQNLLPGTYTLTEVQPAAFVDGIDTIGTPGGTVGNDVFSNIVLPAGYDGVNNNFGERSLLPELYSKRVLIRPALPDDVFNADTGEALNPDTGEVILLAAPVGSTAYDLVGRASNGAWWVGESDGASSFTNQYGTRWSTNVTWEHVMVGDFNGDGVDDIVGRVSHNGDWWVGLSNGDGTFTNTKWTRWSTNVTWEHVMVGDFNGDGMDDLIGRVQSNGDWWIGSSTGTGFTNAKWTRWSTGVTWTDVMVGDFNGDGRDDLIGRVQSNGDWWIGSSTGTGFTNAKWTRWSTNVDWRDVMVGDFNGDGRDDIIGRVSHNGDWWIGSSTGTEFANAKWTRWSTGVTWTDVMVGDFNGDGCDDLVGRVQSNGDWWVASSTGVGFTNAKWTRWSTNVDWLDVMVGDFNGDGADDLVGRVSHNGDWWIGSSTGTGFSNTKWTRWSATAGWDHVMVGNFSAAAMQAESAVEVSQIEPESLTLADLQSVVEEAAFRLTEDMEGLAFQVCITDLAGLRLAVTAGNTILVDDNAAGYGWYVGTTDEAFVATGAEGVLAALADSGAADRMDLLTVVMHEMGHLLGHGHDAEGLMQPTLRAGTRLQPTGDQAAEAYATMAWLDDLAESRKTSDRSVQVQAVDEALMVYWN